VKNSFPGGEQQLSWEKNSFPEGTSAILDEKQLPRGITASFGEHSYSGGGGAETSLGEEQLPRINNSFPGETGAFQGEK
jgi:hypothetical protein